MFFTELTANPHLFDASYTRWGAIRWIPPEDFLTVPDLLQQHGWTTADVAAVAYGDFRRVRST